MHAAIQALNSALAYATFSNADVKNETEKYITLLGTDLEEVNYEPGEIMEQGIKDLNETLNLADEEIENGVVEDDDDEDEDSPFKGLDKEIT